MRSAAEKSDGEVWPGNERLLYFVIFFEVRVKKEGDFFVAEQKKYNILALSYLLMHKQCLYHLHEAFYSDPSG